MANIIGRGMLALAFSNSDLEKRFLLFASGVSNSAETRLSEFSRERALLLQTINENPDSTIIYFSTCSVYQDDKAAYALHKLEMEKLITESAKYYHVYRLPQVVGVVNNTTLVSFFVRSLLSNSRIQVKRDAKRNLVAVKDIVRLVDNISGNNPDRNFITNLASAQSIDVLSILEHISTIVGVSSDFVIVPGGDSYDIPISKQFFSDSDVIFESFYWENVLNEYVPEIIKLVNISHNEKYIN